MIKAQNELHVKKKYINMIAARISMIRNLPKMNFTSINSTPGSLQINFPLRYRKYVKTVSQANIFSQRPLRGDF